MNGLARWLGHRALLALDPERAHGLSIAALRSGLTLSAPPPAPSERLRVRLCGLDFPNPLGMAAGYDKNAEVPDALLSLGFGFAEVGTVTPLPQPGNPKPRIFRLTNDQAVINRLGFNNEGHDACVARLRARPQQLGIVGVNIGANKDSADRLADYELGVRRFAPLASYLTVNVSSPNTPGLRDLQARGALAELLSRVIAARASVRKASRKVPIFLKIAPDLGDDDLADVAAEVSDKGISGVIVSNTTLSRRHVAWTARAREAGGLSGKPLFERSTAVLARMRRLLGPQPALIGVGGVASADAALEKIRAGADLVQLYTGMVYEGPALPASILAGMDDYLAARGLSQLRAIRDERLDFWADKPLD